MKSILEKLYNGEICPNEQICPQNSESLIIEKKLQDEFTYWEDKMSSEDYQRLENLIDLTYEANSMMRFENYLYGFKLATALMIEVQS